MHFGFGLDLSHIDLWNMDLLNTHLDLLDTDISSKYFACLFNVFKTSSRHVFKTSSRQVSRRLQDRSSRRLQDIFSVTIFRLPRLLQDVFARRLQDIFKTSWKTKNCYAKDLWKTSSRRLQDQQMFAGK